MAVLAAFAAPLAPAVAKPPAPSIAVIDIDLIMRDSTAAASIRQQMEKHESTFQTEITAQENALRTADQELAQKKAILAPEAFQAQVQEFQKKVAALGELVQKRKKQLDEGYRGSMKQVRDALMDVVQAQMKEQQVNIVLQKAVVVDVSKDMDLTQDTLKRLNQKLPQVTVKLPAN
jgi:outer membrane protein